MRSEGLQNAGARFTIEYETRSGSADFLSNPTEKRRRENIDFHHIFAAYAHINQWFDQYEHRKQWAANRFYDYLFESVRVIWYEAAKELDSIALFTRLNVGRILLSDAELVKAQLLANSSIARVYLTAASRPPLSGTSSNVNSEYRRSGRS